MQRRTLLLIAIHGSTALSVNGCSMISKRSSGQAEIAQTNAWHMRLAALEQRSGGRLGVSVRLREQSASLSYRGDEMFPMCSTFKLLLVARILHLAQLGEFSLDQSLLYEKKDLVTYSPATEKHADAEGMTVRALCEAAIVLSDNTAANLLLGLQGGPAGLTRWLRTQGDMRTRLDRYETELNAAIADDPRDTTTPIAMSRTAQMLLTEGASELSSENRELLRTWLRASRTGDKRLRVGMPEQWKVGGKTGSGENGTANEVSFVWTVADKPPMVVSVYLTGATALNAAERDAVLADVGRVVADWYRSTLR